MSWFWPFRKNTQPPAVVGSTTNVTPESTSCVDSTAAHVDPNVSLTEVQKTPVLLERPSGFLNGLYVSYCLPCMSYLSKEKKASELSSNLSLEIRSPSVSAPEPVSDVTPVTEIPKQASS